MREIPEMEFCLVYVPHRAELYRLNPSAWYVMRLCNSSTEAQVARAYHAAMEPGLTREQAHEEARAGLEALMRMEIIERVMEPARVSTTTRRRTGDAQAA